jgi:hypothetical protein
MLELRQTANERSAFSTSEELEIASSRSSNPKRQLSYDDIHPIHLIGIYLPELHYFAYARKSHAGIASLHDKPRRLSSVGYINRVVHPFFIHESLESTQNLQHFTELEMPEQASIISKSVLTAVSLITAGGPFLADWNETHIHNPKWPGK